MGGKQVMLQVRGVRVDDLDTAPIVLLADSSQRLQLHLPVGPFEASAIIVEVEGISAPRPMTHDLLADFFSEAGFALDSMELFGRAGENLRARLVYHHKSKRLVKEIRPSDGIALALRLGAPILADFALLSSRQIKASAELGPRVLRMDEWKARLAQG